MNQQERVAAWLLLTQDNNGVSLPTVYQNEELEAYWLTTRDPWRDAAMEAAAALLEPIMRELLLIRAKVEKILELDIEPEEPVTHRHRNPKTPVRASLPCPRCRGTKVVTVRATRGRTTTKCSRCNGTGVRP